MVEEKRKLYKSISKSALRDSQLDYADLEESLPERVEKKSSSSHRHRSADRSRRKQAAYDEDDYRSDSRGEYETEHKSRRDRKHREGRETKDDVEAIRKRKEDSLKNEIESLDSTIGIALSFSGIF